MNSDQFSLSVEIGLFTVQALTPKTYNPTPFRPWNCPHPSLRKNAVWCKKLISVGRLRACERERVAFAGGISSVTIAGDQFGGSFTMDGPLAIPEPSSLTLALIAAGVLIGFRRHFNKNQ